MNKKGLHTARIFDIPVFGKSKDELLKMLQKYLKNDAKRTLWWVNTPNAEQVVLSFDDDIFRSCLLESTINIPDGVSLVLASRLKSMKSTGEVEISHRISHRISGVDLLQDICAIASQFGKRVFLLGGVGQVSEFAAQKLRIQYKGLDVNYFEGSRDIIHESKEERETTLSKIEEFKTDVLFIGFGAPMQEKWVRKNKDNLEKMGVKLVMVVGGAYDMISGNISRAPDWMRKIGMEWLWRLVQQPWRWKRQLRLFRFWGRMIRGN